MKEMKESTERNRPYIRRSVSIISINWELIFIKTETTEFISLEFFFIKISKLKERKTKKKIVKKKFSFLFYGLIVYVLFDFIYYVSVLSILFFQQKWKEKEILSVSM